MKQLITFLTVAFVSLMSYGQNKTAHIEFEKTVIDYGTIEKGSDGVRTFKFTNTGDAPLVITKVTSSCGCTVPKKPAAPILPGKQGEIQVKYDTNRVMPIRKTITVESNAQEARVTLKIKGTVFDPAKVSVLDKKSKSVMEQ